MSDAALEKLTKSSCSKSPCDGDLQNFEITKNVTNPQKYFENKKTVARKECKK